MKRIFPLLLGYCYFIFWFFSKNVMPILTFNMFFCTDTTYNRSNFWLIFLLRKCFAESKTHRAKRTEQSKIPVAILVEQKTGIFFVFCTPLLERKIQKTLKKTKKLEQKMFHVKHFYSNHRETMTGQIAHLSAIANAYLKALCNDWLYDTPDK